MSPPARTDVDRTSKLSYPRATQYSAPTVLTGPRAIVTGTVDISDCSELGRGCDLCKIRTYHEGNVYTTYMHVLTVPRHKRRRAGSPSILRLSRQKSATAHASCSCPEKEEFNLSVPVPHRLFVVDDVLILLSFILPRQ